MRPTNNAARMNYMQIQEQQQLNRQRKLQEEAEAQRRLSAERRVRSQYDYVASNGYGRPGAAGNAGAGAPRATAVDDDVEIRVFVRECDGKDADHFVYREGSASNGGRGGARGGAAGGGRVGGNTRATPRATAAATPSMPESAAPNKGRVPRYLQQRKSEMAAEKRAQEEEAERQRELAKVPPGHRAVSEQEKADTLVKLDERRRELEAELGRIPVRFDTQSIRNRRRNIEDELADIEAARLKYSTKRQLYVPIGS